MSTAPRQTKPARKGAPEPVRRIPAWSGARASPTFTPPPNSAPRTQPNASPATGSFPPLAQANGSRPDAAQDRILQSLSGLTGTTVTISTKTSQRFEGVVASTSGEGDTTGVTLKDVKEVTNPGTPLKDQLFIASTNIDTWSSGPADAKLPNGETFRTDADISQRKGGGRERELQQWSAGPDVALSTDDDTFGPLNNTSWDQFAVNEKLFGVKTNFDENLYTTKLDRSAADFKERERQAQRIANEIIGSATNNPHIAEERNLNVDDSGVNEEDKYGAVVRGTNAYVPPGARKAGAPLPPVNNVASTTTLTTAEIPKVSINGPDGTTLPSQTQSPSSSKAPSPAPTKPPADPLPAFRDFVTNEKQRLTQKRQALVKSEMDKRMAELVKFSQSFKLNKPIPDDLVPILAKDEEKQRAIRDKATKDAASSQARSIGATAPANAARGAQVAAAKISGASQRPAIAPAAKTATNIVAPSQTTVPKAATTTKPTSDTAVKKPAMVIQVIPPFKGSTKPRQSSIPTNGTPSASAATPPGSSSTPGNNGSMSPATAANRLNVNASSFRPNAKANAFTPGGAPPNTANPAANGASSAGSPKPKPETAPNPFFGTRPIKKSPPVNIKDDFNPFKHNKIVEATQVSGLWPYNGKRYAQMFPQPQHQPQHQQSHNMPVPGPPPMPPPSYEEDSAAQAAARGYVYAYPQYGYPGQPMMPGMAPPGPPGAYMPGPYMQPMQYPPGMPPPNAMYTPGMGQMPPQAYMPPPPPGPSYPPPNGAGPRPSVPSTPMPAHVHQYYHQSPQLQHAVPYHMMMPPPPNVPQHPYEGGPAPPVQMGGHA